MQPASLRRNRIALVAIASLLVAAAIFGALSPSGAGLSSVVGPYNLFHFVAGVVGLGIFAKGGPRAAAQFNFAFGLIDLYQAFAGVAGWPPSRLFALRPADHVIHLLFGGALVAVAWPLVRTRGGSSLTNQAAGMR